MAKTTDKALVLRKYPEAISYHWADGWQIYTKRTDGEPLGESGWKRPHRAWNSALNAIVDSQSDAASKPCGTCDDNSCDGKHLELR